MDHLVFGDISIESKYLYARVLDRVSLSRENNWKEEGTGRIYIIYTIEQIMTDLHCTNQKATKLVKELVFFLQLLDCFLLCHVNLASL